MQSFSIVRLVMTFLVVGVVAGLVSFSAAGAVTATCKPRGLLPRYGSFTAVTATSACNAWARGLYSPKSGSGRPRIWHWTALLGRCNQARNPGGSSPFPYTTGLFGVAATSATNAWAVGGRGIFGYGARDYSGTGARRLIEHWNGKAWTVQSFRTGGVLGGVAATSATNAWVVGGHVILHWNGTGWKVQKKVYGLVAVTAISARNAWAVGAGVIMHWNGTGWKVQKKPRGVLNAVTATSATNAWAVGSYKERTVILHCPKVRGLSGVAATSATNAWAVGGGAILHWNGTAWKS